MKPKQTNYLLARIFGASLASLIVLSGNANAGDVTKANNTDALNLGSSWVGGTAPGASDVGVWDSTVTTANSASLGANLSWAGVKVTNPSGLVTIGAGTSGFTIGASGVNMSSATQDVVMSPSWFTLNTSQTWSVASGRVLRIANTATGAANSDVDGASTTVLTIGGAGTVDANQGTTGTGAGWSNFAGKVIVQSGATLRGVGSNAFAWGTNTAADAITLNGGTLATGGTLAAAVGNWSWNTPITLASATTSYLDNLNLAGTSRTLTLAGVITGTGNIELKNSSAVNDTAFRYLFSATNTYSGNTTVNGTARLVELTGAVGTTAGAKSPFGSSVVTANNATLRVQAGSTSNLMTIANGFKLNTSSFIFDDGVTTYTGNFTLTGTNALNVRYSNKNATLNGVIADGASAGGISYTGNSLYLNGVNTYTGGTTSTSGSIIVSSSQGLGTGPVTLDGGVLYFNPTAIGGTSTISSIRTRNDILLGNNVLCNISSGNLQMRMTNGFWIKASGTGSIGRLTSSSGTLNFTSVDGSWLTTTGTLTSADHQVQTPIVDYNGSTPLTITKSGVNDLYLTVANTYTGGTTINSGRIRVNNTSSFGTGTVTVNSGGTAMLSAAGTYANNFSIAGNGVTEATGNFGALRFLNNTVSGSVSIAAGGARIGGISSVTGTLAGAVTGSGPLEINSSASTHNSAITISGNASGYTGAATVSQGSLTISNSFGGTVTKASGATLINNGNIAGDHTHTTGTLQGTGIFAGNLTLNGTTTADVLNIVPGAMHVLGNLTLNGTTTVRASGLGGEVPVLLYDGTLTGSKSNLSLENATSFRPGTDFDTSTSGLIKLVVIGNHVTWTNGASNMIWNTTDNDWINTDTSTADKYFQSDYCTFGDTGAGTIALSGIIAPRSITINNSTGNNYTFTGDATNLITGTTGITKSGAGALTLSSSHTFLGAVSLSGGLTTFSARQGYTGGTSITDGAILDLSGGGGEAGAIQGTVNISGSGSTLRLSVGDATGWGVVTNRISTINVSNGGELQINNGSANQTFSNLAINLTGASVTKGPGATNFNGNFDCFSGSTSISSNASSDTSIIGAGLNVGLRQAITTITTALGTTTSGIDLQINASINNSPSSFTTPNLVKSGAGTLCLNNPPASGIGSTTVYTGSTTINSGTLIIGTGGTTGNIGTGAILDNSALIFNRSDEITVANTITGTGTLEQKGSGILNLTAGGDRSGETLVSSGTLRVGTTAFTASTFRTSGGSLAAGTATTAGTATIPALNLNGGGVIHRVSTTVHDQFTVPNLSVNAPTTVTCVAFGSLQVGDRIPLIDYTGSIGGTLGFAGLSIASSGNPHYAFTLDHNTTDTRVDAIVGTADTLIWKGTQNGTWDVQSTENWQTASNNLGSLFYDYDRVKFTDAGAAEPNVILDGDIKPAIVEFDAASTHYTLDGVGITGSTTLVKTNTGTVTLNNANTYTGATTINGGTLELADSGSLTSTTITNNATFAINRANASTFTNVIGGSGQFVKRGAGDLTINAANTFTGPVVVETGTLILGSAASLGTNAAGLVVQSGATVNLNNITLGADETLSLAGTGVAGYAATGTATIQGNVILTGNATIGDGADTRINLGTNTEPINLNGGSYTLTKAGISRVWYRGVANGLGNSLGALVINGGTFGIETYDNALGSVPVTVNTGGILSAWANGAGTVATTQSTIITLNGGTLGSDFSGQTWSGPVTLTADSTLGATNSALNFTISGAISGDYGLTKTQTSTVTLSAVNTYTGNTTINTGTINLAASGGMKFVLGANGVNNKITGAGTAALNGTFTLDLTNAAIADGNSWILVDATTKTFGATFSINGFTKSGTTHTKVLGTQTWTFSEATGILSLAVAQGYTSWIDGFSLASGDKDPMDDPDSDGFNNLLEYVLGGNPNSNNQAIVPVGTLSGADFVLNFSRNDLAVTAADATIILEYSTDLATWTPVTVPLTDSTVGSVAFDITDGSPNDTIQATIPTSGATKFFARIKTSLP